MQWAKTSENITWKICDSEEKKKYWGKNVGWS